MYDVSAEFRIRSDGSPAGIRDGAIHATVVQQPYEFGYQAITRMAQALKGDRSCLAGQALLTRRRDTKVESARAPASSLSIMSVERGAFALRSVRSRPFRPHEKRGVGPRQRAAA